MTPESALHLAKAVADYELGPDAEIPAERAPAAIETAGRFVARIADLIGP